MKTRTKFAACLLAIAPFAALADEGADSNSCLNKIVFSQEFLAKYPNAGKACREVVTKNGKKYARFDANVVDVKGNEVTADFTDSYNNPVTTVKFTTTPDARVQMEGTEVKASELKPGDKLSFWVPESRAGFYAEPGASNAKKLAVESSKPAER
ncbi:MAG TPA: hypothetical protein VFS52_07270 [Steroidobacteraceae bacterium]|jgi:hypothetical protein|nr:hypothetical protein [Steroidobacteraceae bacterium]